MGGKKIDDRSWQQVATADQTWSVNAEVARQYKMKDYTAVRIRVETDDRKHLGTEIMTLSSGNEIHLPNHLAKIVARESGPFRVTVVEYPVKTDRSTISPSPDNWSEEEVAATLDAYLDMLNWEQTGVPYVKTQISKNLREGVLSTRSKGSIEYRMQNISAVLDEFGLARIKGYLPAKNVGKTVRAQIVRLLDRRGFLDAKAYEPTANMVELEERSLQLQKRGFSKPPEGTLNPGRTIATRQGIMRNPAITAWVRYNAAGRCELCLKNAPFLDGADEPFLEVHHVLRLADGGPDVVENAVALCPNCHRHCHHAKDAVLSVNGLYERLGRLKRFESA